MENYLTTILSNSSSIDSIFVVTAIGIIYKISTFLKTRLRVEGKIVISFNGSNTKEPKPPSRTKK